MCILEVGLSCWSVDDKGDARIVGEHAQLHGRSLRGTANSNEQQPIKQTLRAREVRVQAEVGRLRRVQADVVHV